MLFIADRNNNRIRRVDLRSGIITTVAGSGTQGFSGDNGPATSAGLKLPTAVVLDSTGNLFFSDTDNNRVRRVDAATGVITTVAGTDQAGFSGDKGPATSAALSSPVALKIDAAGNLYVSDSGNSRIRKVAASTGIITTVAGNGISGFTGDNTQATNTALKLPSFLDFDAAGNLLFADTGNYRIRGIRAPIP